MDLHPIFVFDPIIYEKEITMKKLLKKCRLGTAGLTLIELIVSMAILAVIGTAIGGAMYVSSRSYTRGSSEINVQEEAQVASNLICDWIMDATAVSVNGTNDVLTITHPDDNYGEIVITVGLNGSGELEYSFPKPGGGTESGVLASYVTGVKFNSTFDTDRNVKISLDFNVNDRTYHAVTDTTSRNYDFVSTGGTTPLTPPTIGFEGIIPISGTYYVYLEPGQNASHNGPSSVATFTFKAKLYACDPATTTFTLDGGTSSSHGCTTMTMSPVPGSPSEFNVTCTSTDTADNTGTPMKYTFVATNSNGSDSKPVTIVIRRAHECTFNLAAVSGVKTAYLQNGTQGTAGSVYSPVTLNLGVQNNDPHLTAWYDSGLYGYKDASQVMFIYRIKDDAGNWHDAKAEGYVTDSSLVEVTSGATPSVQVTLARNITKDLYVYAVARHAGTFNTSQCGGFTVYPDNKVSNIQGSPFSYGSYADYFIIKAGSGMTPTNVGDGIRRGQPACMVGEWPTGYRDYLTQAIEDAYNDAHAGYTSYQTLFNQGKVKYSTYIKYREKGTSTWSTYVIMNTTNVDTIIYDYGSRRIRDNASNLFALDKEYEVEFYLDAFVDGQSTPVVHSGNSGAVPKVTPYFYNSTTGLFESTTYSPNSMLNYNTGTNYYSNIKIWYPYNGSPNDESKNAYVIPVFFEGTMQNSNQVQYHLEVKQGSNWVACDAGMINDNNIWKNEYHFEYSVGSGTPTIDFTKVKLPGGKTWTVNQYSELTYPDVGVNIQFVNINNGQLDSGKEYRVVFTTSWPLSSLTSSGVIGGSDSQIGTTSAAGNPTYTLKYGTDASVPAALRGQPVCIYIDT